MDRQIGVGVIGLGWMGRVHTSAYRRVLEHFPDLGVTPRLAAAADVSPGRRAHAEHVGFARTHEDWRAVLEDPEVEAVSITLPNAMHREVALAAIEAGKHVWVEKPVGRGTSRTPSRWPTPPATRGRSTPSASVTASRPPCSTPAR